MTGLEFAAVALIGVLIGRFLPNRRKGPKPQQPVEPICGCDHHRSFHDPQTGQCHGLMRGNPLRYDEDWNTPTAYKQVPCTCRQYSGPVPLPEFYAPEIASGDPS
jgi:hypothetical protein